MFTLAFLHFLLLVSFLGCLFCSDCLGTFELVEDRNKDKPKIFVDWPESLIIEVLECLSRCPLHTNTAPATKVSVSEDISQNKFSFG